MIGQEIARQLDPENWDILLYDDGSNVWSSREGYVGTEFFGTMSLEGILDMYQPDVISHQAAVVGVGESMYWPEKYIRQNAMFTGELIQAIIDTKWKGTILHASSMGIFGEQDEPAAEGTSEWPLSFYGLTKQFQENALVMLVNNYPGIVLCSLRYFSVYSSTFNPENPFTGILSVIVNQILDGGPVEMYGDGTQTRDLIHVRDVASIHNHILENGVEWESVNVCTGRSFTLEQIVNMVCWAMDYRGPVLFNEKQRAGDIHSSQGDASRLRSFYPNPLMGLEQGIKAYCDFVKANRDKFKAGSVKRENQNIQARGLVK